MEIEAHGGGCCGVTHIHEFMANPNKRMSNWDSHPGMTYLEAFKSFVKNFLDVVYDGSQIDGYEGKWSGDWDDELVPTDKKFSCILEACLTDAQMMEWAPHLKEAGFKVVTRFLNSNSGNVVNILHYNPAGRREIGKAPYKW